MDNELYISNSDIHKLERATQQEDYKSMVDYRLRLDGALDDLWEPLWRIPVRLFHEEQLLIRSRAVRRLHFLRHGGASFINSHHTYSRLQHTLGVFALTAYFEPENRALRMAALLHDAGHAPFSHTLDSLEGVALMEELQQMLGTYYVWRE